ncbi:MAG: hypothetical protein M3328_11950, partial [Chloroflexota bacterium]|nr:hypothetical protein [Chloroflexota bacterium]
VEDWLPVEEGKFRWTALNYARLHVWSGSNRTASLRFKLSSFGGDRAFSVTAGNVKLAGGTLTEEGSYVNIDFQVPKGFSTVAVTAGGEPVAPIQAGAGPDYRPLVMRLSECSYSAR